MCHKFPLLHFHLPFLLNVSFKYCSRVPFYWTDFSYIFLLKLEVAYYLRRYMSQSPYYCSSTRSFWIPNDQRLSQCDVRPYIMSRHSIRNSLEKNIFCYAAFYIVLMRKYEGKDCFEDSGVGESKTLKWVLRK